jgi:hypothetical protein
VEVFRILLESHVQPEPDPTAGRNRGYWIGITLVVCAMVALAVWAWWLPNGVFDPWIAKVKQLPGIKSVLKD